MAKMAEKPYPGITQLGNTGFWIGSAFDINQLGNTLKQVEIPAK